MRISDFLANLLDFGERDKSGNLVLSKTLADTAKNRLNIEELALFSTVDLVASTAAMCEWKNKNAVIPLFDGYDYTPDTGPAAQKLNGEIADLESIMKQAQDRSCNAYHVPPTLLRGDVTNQNDAVKSMLTFAVKPPVLAVQTEVNRKMYGRKVLEGWHTKIDMTHIRVVDIFDVAVNLDKLIQDSVLNTNESREMTGLDKIPEAWADEYQRTKNMEAVTTPAKGGENT